MKDVIYLLLHLLTTCSPPAHHLLTTFTKLQRPGGCRAVIAENLILKQQLLYSPGGGRKSGPKGPSKEVINAIVEMKRRNPRFGCPRIAQQINLALGLELDKDTVRRVLATHYRSDPSDRGPSLTTIGHAKDSLWSVDLFRCESILLKSHWVMVVMDQYTRRIIGFGVHAGNVDDPTLCRMFNQATSKQSWPEYLSSDNDPLFQ